jgi:pimeloyl-ACP methyl ester carboxylesterase
MIVKLVFAALATIPLLLTGGLAFRRLRQRQVARALVIDTPDGIAEEKFVRLGGAEQWIQIRGESRGNPVLLILHGGPGWPNAVFNLPLRAWEKHFTLVQWDHRGTGKTLRRSKTVSRREMTFECRVADAAELAEFLRRYLHKDRIVLLAESLGTLTGLPLVKLRPDLFSAIVVTDLYVDVIRNESVKYQMTLDRLRHSGSHRVPAGLKAIGADPTRWGLRGWNINMAWAFKTNLPAPNIDRKLLFPLVISSPIYTLRDIYTLLVGFQQSTTAMLDEMLAFDARRLGPEFDVPFFLFQGENDVITITSLALEYFDEVAAPQKARELILNAGHFAAFTKPEQFLSALLTHVHPLANRPGKLLSHESVSLTGG